MPPATNTNSSSPFSASMRTAPGRIRVMSGVWPGRMPSSPASPGSATNFAWPEKICSSALTTSTLMVAISVDSCGDQGERFGARSGPVQGWVKRSERHRLCRRLPCGSHRARGRRPLRYTRPLLDLLGLFEGFVDRADHVEGLFRQVVALAFNDHLEAADRFLQRNVLAGRTREHFSNVERLRQETLDLTSARHGELVFRREFDHAQNRDNVAQFLVALQRLLHAARDR